MMITTTATMIAAITPLETLTVFAFFGFDVLGDLVVVCAELDSTKESSRSAVEKRSMVFAGAIYECKRS